MFEIQGKLVSLDLIEKNFVCNISACKGACCVEGEQGAPVDESEILHLNDVASNVIPLLDTEAQSILTENKYTQHDDGSYSTPLRLDRSCAYSIRNSSGILTCGIEKAYQEGLIDWIKPLSCHLYPIRIKQDKSAGWEALNYEQWNICTPACKQGDALGIPIYRFVKAALIRKYGSSFYQELDEVAQAWKQNK